MTQPTKPARKSWTQIRRETPDSFWTLFVGFYTTLLGLVNMGADHFTQGQVTWAGPTMVSLGLILMVSSGLMRMAWAHCKLQTRLEALEAR